MFSRTFRFLRLFGERLEQCRINLEQHKKCLKIGRSITFTEAIIELTEFNFTVNLYNFGIIFSYPTNYSQRG